MSRLRSLSLLYRWRYGVSASYMGNEVNVKRLSVLKTEEAMTTHRTFFDVNKVGWKRTIRF